MISSKSIQLTFFKCHFSFSSRYLADLMDSPELVRNVAICGHLHHGKVRQHF
jgi:hypothetical protein